jgi:hypothetical protein
LADWTAVQAAFVIICVIISVIISVIICVVGFGFRRVFDCDAFSSTSAVDATVDRLGRYSSSFLFREKKRNILKIDESYNRTSNTKAVITKTG